MQDSLPRPGDCFCGKYIISLSAESIFENIRKITIRLQCRRILKCGGFVDEIYIMECKRNPGMRTEGIHGIF